MKTKVVKWGNSLGLRIPKSFAEEVQVSEGSIVDLSMDDGQLVIRVATQPAYSLEDLLREITEENLHSEIDMGEPLGSEEW
jgi:antitoxin MazE